MPDPRTAERRPISYATFDDLARDIDTLEAAHRAGTLRHTANWTPGHLPGPFSFNRSGVGYCGQPVV